MKKSVITLSVLLGLACSQAMASTTELTITGTITPSACTPTLGNNGVIDYGRLSVEGLEEQGSYYRLPFKQVNLSIDCGAPATFALIATDNRRASATGSLYFGLGMHNNQKIGLVALEFPSQAELDGQQRDVLLSSDAGQSWTRKPVLFPTNSYPDNRIGFGDSTPIAGSHLNTQLHVYSLIAKSLPYTDDIQLDGSATLEVYYL